MVIGNLIKVNNHGHGLPDYSEKWKKKLGVAGRNTAEIISERCIEEDIGIYTLTNEPEFPGFREKTRYNWVRDAAIALSAQPDYEFNSLGQNAFHLKVSRNGEEKETIFQRGQSLRITDKSLKTGNLREYEMLTFGRDGIIDFKSFDEAFKYLNDEGLPAIGEHLLAYGHHGPMEMDRIKKYCANGNFLAVEHNAKIAMPNICSLLPPIGPLKKVRGATKRKNTDLAKLVKYYGTPVIANDDADFPEQIGAAYTEFLRNKIRTDKDENIREDLITLIRNNDFYAHKEHLSKSQVFRYAALIVLS